MPNVVHGVLHGVKPPLNIFTPPTFQRSPFSNFLEQKSLKSLSLDLLISFIK